MINTFSTLTRYSKISIALLYTNGKLTEKKFRETPFIIASNNAKYLGETLTKQVKDLYDKYFKRLEEEIEEKKSNDSVTYRCG